MSPKKTALNFFSQEVPLPDEIPNLPIDGFGGYAAFAISMCFIAKTSP